MRWRVSAPSSSRCRLPGWTPPVHVDRRLREEFQSRTIAKNAQSGDDQIDVLYVTSDKPHQQSLFAGPEMVDYGVAIQKKVDAVYVTRFQKERYSEEKQAPYLKIDAKFMKDARYADASVMHPLPRVDELDVDLSTDRRAVLFSTSRLRRADPHGADHHAAQS